jgi:transcriptional regulator with XRE-family HTH domain
MSSLTRGSSRRRIPRNQLLASALTAARQRAGMTQRQLAAQLARAPSFAGKIELGEQELRVVDLSDYARALGMDAAELLGKVEPSSSRALNADALDPPPNTDDQMSARSGPQLDPREFLSLDPSTMRARKTERDSMVGVTGFEPATYTSRT